MKRQNGITLIALIVTVIVMLILAGVGIVFSVGDEGVITKSKLAKQEIESAEQNDRDLAGETLDYPNKTDNCKHKETETRNATTTYTGDIYCTNCGALLTTGGIIVCENHPSTTVTEAVVATCCTKGNTGDTVCTVCGAVVTPGTESDYNTSNHSGGTEVRNASDSYTGDTYCLGCGVIIEKGKVNLDNLQIGDYVNYPVYYNNVPGRSSYDGVGTYIPLDEYNGWRVLSIEENENGQYVRLVSAGLPLNYYKHNGEPAVVSEALTTQFFDIAINSTTKTKYSYYDCGFKSSNNGTVLNDIESVKDLFINEYTQIYSEGEAATYTDSVIGTTFSNSDVVGEPKVRCMTKEDLDSVLGKTATYNTYVTSNDLLAIPASDSGYAIYWMGSAFSTSTSVANTWQVDETGKVHWETDQFIHMTYGVRPVVCLKPEVTFVPVSDNVWNIEITE